MRARKRARRLAEISCAAAVALISASGCGGSDDDEDGNDGGGASEDGGPGSDGGGGGGGGEEVVSCVEASGTRLKKVVLDHGGDDADFVRFLDTDYGAGTECRFQTAADGTLRCLPTGSDTPVFTQASRYWTDAGCSNSIVEISFEGTPTSFTVYDGPQATCAGTSTPPRHYQAGSRLDYDGDETIYERDYFTGACTATTSSFNRSYYTLGAEIPATTFVFGLESMSTGRLETRSITGEDGSRSCDHFAFRDKDRDETCTLSVAEDGAIRCLPHIGFQNTFFTDAGCTAGATPATAQQAACAASNPRYIQAPPAACTGRVLFRRAPKVAGQFYLNIGTCTALEAGYEVFPVGAHVQPTEFVELVDERSEVGGRLQRVDLVGGGARLHKDLWFDPELDNTCWFRRTENGTWRCVPVTRPGAPVASRSALRTGYTDAACTAPVQAAAEDCTGVAPRYIVDTGDASRVYPVGEKLAQLYQSAGTCVAVAGNWYQVGAALPFDSLVSAYESTP
jgi:hypothetical protein